MEKDTCGTAWISCHLAERQKKHSGSCHQGFQVCIHCVLQRKCTHALKCKPLIH